VSPGKVLYKLTRAGSERLVFHSECLSSGEMSGTACLQVRRYWTSVRNADGRWRLIVVEGEAG